MLLHPLEEQFLKVLLIFANLEGGEGTEKPDIEGKWATGKQKDRRPVASESLGVAIRRGVDFTEIASGDVANPVQMVVHRHERIRSTRNA